MGEFRLLDVTITVEVDYEVCRQFGYEPREFNNGLMDHLHKKASDYVGISGQVIAAHRDNLDLEEEN